LKSEPQQDPIVIKGKLFTGEGKAAFFTQLDWVREQSLEKTGFAPYPGTVNIEVLDESLPHVDAIRKMEAVELIPPESGFCTGRVLPARIGDIPASVILPEDDVNIHGANVLEIMAPVNLRESLGKEDGDIIVLEIASVPFHVSNPSRQCNAGIILDKEKTPIEAILFDLDGTLIDSTEAYYRIVEIVLEKMNFPPVPRDIMLQAAENGSFNWPMILPDLPLQERDKIINKLWAEVATIYPEIFRTQVKLFPDTKKVIGRIIELGPPLGIVTATSRANMTEKLGLLDSEGILQHFREIITSDDTEKRKPDPSPLLLCARRLNASPERCLYIGDKTEDICAGKAAGMKTVAVVTGVDSYERLVDENPDILIDSLGDISEMLFRHGQSETEG
jgi:HAD superfamily hydrolase (TIGR01549 family)